MLDGRRKRYANSLMCAGCYQPILVFSCKLKLHLCQFPWNRMGDEEGTFYNPKAAANIVTIQTSIIGHCIFSAHLQWRHHVLYHSKQEVYTQDAMELHGPEFDAMNASIDKVSVYRAGYAQQMYPVLTIQILVSTCYLLKNYSLSMLAY